MSEIKRYNGLTTADKGALLDAKANGFKVFCETSNRGRVFYSKHPSVSETNSKIISIDIALAQIAEMETAQTTTIAPLTWNERINQMTVEEKARWMLNRGTEMHNESAKYAWDNSSHKFEEMYLKRMIDFFNSPYTEGETE